MVNIALQHARIKSCNSGRDKLEFAGVEARISHPSKLSFVRSLAILWSIRRQLHGSQCHSESLCTSGHNVFRRPDQNEQFNCLRPARPWVACDSAGLKLSTPAPQPFFPARRLGLLRNPVASFLPGVFSEAQRLGFDFGLPSFSSIAPAIFSEAQRLVLTFVSCLLRSISRLQ